VAARTAFARALAIAPDDPVIYNSRGWFLHAQHGRHAAAIADYDRAIRLNPNYSYAFNNRGWSRYRMGEVEKGLADIEKARRRKVFNPYIYRNLGIIALERGERQRACEQFRKALAYGFTERFGNEVKDLTANACTGAENGLTPVQAPNAPLSAPTKNAPVRTNAP
jgi:Tfp pilus assembly protein PilF